MRATIMMMSGLPLVTVPWLWTNNGCSIHLCTYYSFLDVSSLTSFARMRCHARKLHRGRK